MDIARNELIFREAAANDVIALGLREEDPNQGIRKMMAQIGQNMKADRFYIFEELVPASAFFRSRYRLYSLFRLG